MRWLRELVFTVSAGLALLSSGVASAKAWDTWESLSGLNTLSVEILGADTNGAKWAGLTRESVEHHLRYVLQKNHMTLTNDVHRSMGTVELAIFITASKENDLCLFHTELRVVSAAKIVATKRFDPKAIIWETGRTGLSGQKNAAAGIQQSILFLAKDLALEWNKANPRP